MTNQEIITELKKIQKQTRALKDEGVLLKNKIPFIDQRAFGFVEELYIHDYDAFEKIEDKIEYLIKDLYHSDE